MARQKPTEVKENIADENEIDEEILELVKEQPLLDRLQGRNGRLRKSKPTTDRDNGLIQYVWRKATFHAGYDSSIPVTASWWLQEFLEKNGIEASVSGSIDERGTRIIETLQKVTDAVLLELGEDPTGAAKRWSGLL